MLDESYPTFFLKPSADNVKHHENYLFTQHGSDPDATYSLHHVDPASNAAKNTYAVALYDSHNPDILYGEVLAKPGWSHPTLSQDEIRKNGGVPPPPQPIYPTEFAIQLYNPDTQVIVKQQSSKWSGTVSWEFSLPQVTFRTPSASTLDRTQDDPGRDATTPRVNFAWRKEGRLGKDMTCYMTGKSTDVMGKKAKKSKEPDIAVAMFSGLKEMTIMESNLYRVELEDYKGLEVVLLLGAAVIRDLFFSDPVEQFHILEPASRKPSGGLLTRKTSSPVEGSNITPPVMTPQPPPPPPYTGPSQYPQEKAPLQPARGPAENAQIAQVSSSTLAAKRSSLPPLQTQAHSSRPSEPQRPQQPPQARPTQPLRPQQQQQQQSQQSRLQQQRQQQPPKSQPQQHPTQTQSRPQQHPPRNPPQQPPRNQPQQPLRPDPRTQWEINAETARLKAQVENEEKRQAAVAAKARRKQEAESERKTRQFLEQERKQAEKERERAEKERKRRQAEVDKETERLKKQFGDQSNLLQPARQQQQQRHSAPHVWSQQPQRPPPAPLPQGPYLSAPGGHRPTASASSFFSGGKGNGNGNVQGFKEKVKEKKSFWGLRSQSETSAEKLRKKKSNMF